MKKSFYRRFVLILVLLIVLAAAVIVILRTDILRGVLPSLSLVRREAAFSSEILFSRAADLLEIETIEIVRKTVFPYDFVPENYPWAVLQSRAKNGASLTAEETLYLEAFNTARGVGMNLAVPDYRFVVATLRIRAGFDLADWKADPARAVEYDPETNSAVIHLPAVTILDIAIEDPVPETYEYPDIRINPEQWRTLSAFLKNRTAAAGLDEEIRAEAGERGREFIRAFLGAAGVERVFFDQSGALSE